LRIFSMRYMCSECGYDDDVRVECPSCNVLLDPYSEDADDELGDEEDEWGDGEDEEDEEEK